MEQDGDQGAAALVEACVREGLADGFVLTHGEQSVDARRRSRNAAELGIVGA
jgi:hypothetical protein